MSVGSCCAVDSFVDARVGICVGRRVGVGVMVRVGCRVLVGREARVGVGRSVLAGAGVRVGRRSVGVDDGANVGDGVAAGPQAASASAMSRMGMRCFIVA